jgi:hypothetical protein
VGIKSKYQVRSIDSNQCKEWLLYKHYAKRIPAIIYSFGLYDADLILNGVCTFGTPARMLNMGYGVFDGKLSIETIELNRLCVNDGLEKNTLSFFVAECLRILPKPVVVVSYADGNKGHHGYIYQATNWIYTGITSMEKIYIDKRTNEVIHPRTIVSTYGSREAESLPDHIEISKEESGKYRYFQFLGDKRKVNEMKKNLKYQILPYPKGQNDRYDSGYHPTVQGQLF